MDPHKVFLMLVLPWLVAATTDSTPACKIRITRKGLELVKQEGLRFVEQELENLTIPDLSGNEGKFQYTISNVTVTDLQLALSDLHFQPKQHFVFYINNASISLSFQRKLLFWVFYDIGSINASAEGVFIKTEVRMAKDMAGRLKIANMTCEASIGDMQADFDGTLSSVYGFLGSFLITGMRYLLNRQICPLLNHAGLVLLNSVLNTVPVRKAVDNHTGIDYALLSDPDVTYDTLDMNFKGMFFHLKNENDTLPNLAVSPVIKEQDRMVYVGLSEYFFDSAIYAYYKADVLKINITEEKMPKDLELLLRTTYFGNILLLKPEIASAPLKLEFQVSSPPRFIIKPQSTTISVTATADIFLVPTDLPPEQLSSITMELKLGAKVLMKGKKLQVQLDVKRFRMYSNQSALESLALIPLQNPLKTLLQLVVMPIINERTKQGVEIPVPEGMDFIKETVTNHAGYIVIGGDIHFSTSLRDVIEKYRTAPSPQPTAAE
uniref:Phospholipid transfer protein n=1 Tax=Geotrypetes seraphini TaxID=260995 RepID=A0A6P8NMF4_GEOSA|nr:phospholipid transfer protein [Geotrypetes seraphini]XP_033770299.1 phospholipid transfer protein [Geotrypetes seraphini]XP_033770300.1 phospholipid transfer protein [Geotrypetes seraphini]XP_033770302.1 phospholipid transfer protein [Geotrypetes seraphini]